VLHNMLVTMGIPINNIENILMSDIAQSPFKELITNGGTSLLSEIHFQLRKIRNKFTLSASLNRKYKNRQRVDFILGKLILGGVSNITKDFLPSETVSGINLV